MRRSTPVVGLAVALALVAGLAETVAWADGVGAFRREANRAAGGGGALSAVLAIGNDTGGTDISVDTGDALVFDSANDTQLDGSAGSNRIRMTSVGSSPRFEIQGNNSGGIGSGLELRNQASDLNARQEILFRNGGTFEIMSQITGRVTTAGSEGRIEWYVRISDTLTEVMRLEDDHLDLATHGLRFGSALGTNDLELERTGVRELTLDDPSGGGTVTLIVDGDVQATSITGVVDTYEAHTGDDTLTDAESGSVHSNLGAGVTVTITLPSGSASGVTFTFTRPANQAYRVDPAAGEAIIYSGGGQMANGEYLELGAVGSTITLVKNTSTQWETTSESGTLTEETP